MSVQLGKRNFNLPLEESLLIRLDFSNDEAWRSLCEAVKTPTREDGFVGHFDIVDEKALDGTQVDDLIAMLPEETLYIADSRTMSDPERSILVVGEAGGDLEDAPPVRSSFRTIPEVVWGPENNLSIGNMDFEEFVHAAGDDGVFRGFGTDSQK